MSTARPEPDDNGGPLQNVWPAIRSTQVSARPHVFFDFHSPSINSISYPLSYSQEDAQTLFLFDVSFALDLALHGSVPLGIAEGCFPRDVMFVLLTHYFSWNESILPRVYPRVQLSLLHSMAEISRKRNYFLELVESPPQESLTQLVPHVVEPHIMEYTFLLFRGTWPLFLLFFFSFTNGPFPFPPS